MFYYVIAIDLPSSIKHQLTSLCYGLPYVQWTEEENFHLTLRFIGQLNDQLLFDVKDALSQLSFEPFSITLQGITSSPSKHGEGNLSLGFNPTLPIHKLKKHIDKNLSHLALNAGPNHPASKPQITLGKYTNLAPHKLAEYLSLHSLYQSEKIDVSQFALFRFQIGSKKIIYQEIESYPLAPSLPLE